MLYRQCCCNVEIATSNSQFLRKVSATRSNSQRCSNTASMLDSKFGSQHIMNLVFTTLMQRFSRSVKFTTSSRRRYYDVGPTLRQRCEELKMWTWSHHGHIVTFPQSCLKVLKTFSNGTAFVWYEGSLLWHPT